MAKAKTSKQNSKKKANKIDREGPNIHPALKHILAYFSILLIALLYFKPYSFENKALSQHDNFQSTALTTEFRKYKETGENTYWTNQYFCGTPLNLIANQTVNHAKHAWKLSSLFQPYENPWASLLVIMLFCYIALQLLGLNFVTSLSLSVILGFFTANTLYINAGHTGKMHVLATAPLLIASMLFTFRKNILLGSSIFALTLAVNLMKNHIQITYYTFLALGFLGLFLLIEAIKEQKLSHFFKASTALVIAVLIGILSNIGFLWPIYEYSDESTRGKTELTKKDHDSGLSKDYVFAFSYEKAETFSMIYPNFYGGTQGKSFYNQEGSTQTALTLRNPQVAKQLGQVAGDQAGRYLTHYRGSQNMCGGPIYYGIVTFFLMILAVFLVQGLMKWAFVSAFLFFVLLAWGTNFALFNNFMYDYFPLYSKFRDTKMTLLVGQPLMILFVGLGLKELFHFNPDNYLNTWGAKLLFKIKQDVSAKGYVLLAGLITTGLTLAVLFYGLTGSPSAKSDQFIAGIPALVSALQADRATLIYNDAISALMYLIPAIIVLYLYTKGTLNIMISSIAIAVLACLDLGLVNSDYLNEDSYTDITYVEKAKSYPPTKADQDILNKDNSYYRVADYSRGAPSQSAYASFFHKSVGGYSAAKPQLYQELWTGYNMDDPQIALKRNSNIFNMLNVKYLIVSPERSMDNPTALGNAWFVDSLIMVNDANEELEGLAGLATQNTAVVQKKYASYLENLQNKSNTSDRIYLSNYHPDTLTYEADCKSERFAVFSEAYYPPEKGWKVFINDQEIESNFIKVNYMLRGLRIPAGKNTIKMIFAPESIILGSKISNIFSLIIWIVFFFALFNYFKKQPENKV